MEYDPISELILSLDVPLAYRYSIEQVAIILGLTTKQVRAQIKKGRLKGIRGSRNRIIWVRHSDLVYYFAAINGGTL